MTWRFYIDVTSIKSLIFFLCIIIFTSSVLNSTFWSAWSLPPWSQFFDKAFFSSSFDEPLVTIRYQTATCRMFLLESGRKVKWYMDVIWIYWKNRRGEGKNERIRPSSLSSHGSLCSLTVNSLFRFLTEWPKLSGLWLSGKWFCTFVIRLVTWYDFCDCIQGCYSSVQGKWLVTSHSVSECGALQACHDNCRVVPPHV